MPYVMRHETWMDLTARGITKPRSSELKKLDDAVEAYEKIPTGHNLAKLRVALHNWKVTKGGGYGGGGKPPWVDSVRNHKRGVETLSAQVYGSDKPLRESVLKDLAALPFYGIEAMAENEARIFMQKARLEALNAMFAGQRLKAKPMAIAKMGRDLKKKIDKVRKSSEQVKTAATDTAKQATGPIPNVMPGNPLKQQAQRIVNEIIQEVVSETPEILNELVSFLNDLVPDFVGEAAGALVPYLSVATGSFKATKAVAKAAKQEIKLHKTEKHTGAVAHGDPEAAAEAVLRMIRRARNKEATLAGIYATDVAVKGAAIAADAAAFGAPAVSGIVTPLQGLATALAVLTLNIRAAARDVLEMRRANKMMAGSVALNIALFDKNPLLGCYFIAASTHSDIINFLVEDIGEVGWMYDVETMMKKHVIPLQGTARSFIDDARFEIPGLSMQQGARTVTKFEKMKQLAHKVF